jgi:hypothetical protein
MLAAIQGPNGKIYAIGGYDVSSDGTWTLLATVEEYDPMTNTWASVTSMPTGDASLGAAVGSNGRLYIIGGGPSYSPTPIATVLEGSFSTKVTYDNVGNLVKQFVTKPGIVNSLLTKLDNARAAEARGDAKAKAGIIGAFINEVQAQSGKAISAEHAATLIALARDL